MVRVSAGRREVARDGRRECSQAAAGSRAGVQAASIAPQQLAAVAWLVALATAHLAEHLRGEAALGHAQAGALGPGEGANRAGGCESHHGSSIQCGGTELLRRKFRV